MFYLTGNTHGNFERVERFCYEMGTTKEDVLILLGDTYINLDHRKVQKLEFLGKLPITLFCINNDLQYGNAESPVDKQIWNNGIVFVERKYPNLLFAKSGEIYNFDGQSVLVIGINEYFNSNFSGKLCAIGKALYNVKRKIIQNLRQQQNKVDIILSPMCPMSFHLKKTQKKYSRVNRILRHWLGKIEKIVQYKEWYCDFHVAKTVGKINFMCENYDVLINNFLED